MKAAVQEFQAGDVRRVVVYVDDLDRCLPPSALEVLESMKLFFDLDGFVCVVGLDQQVIEGSSNSGIAPLPSRVRTRTGATQPATRARSTARRTSRRSSRPRSSARAADERPRALVDDPLSGGEERAAAPRPLRPR
jgi:hypothetical protein